MTSLTFFHRVAALACAVVLLATAQMALAQTEGRYETPPPSVLSKMMTATAGDAVTAMTTARAACFTGTPTMSGNADQAAVYTTTLQGFPTQGVDYLILSTGYANPVAGTALTFQSHGMSGPSLAAGAPYSSPNLQVAYDVITLSVPFTIPSGSNAVLSFDWRFGSEENPTYTNSFTDYFRADIFDGSLTHLGNIARLPNNNQVTTQTAAAFSNTPGGSSSVPTAPYPTPNDVVYNAMTGTYTASIDLSAYTGQTITIQFRLADVRDAQLNSAVFLDNLDLAVCPTATFALTPNLLWPPNHKMSTITVTPPTLSSCYSWRLASVTSNEPDDGEDDGNTINDIQGVDAGTADLSFMLRAERSGIGTGRIYTATFEILDAAGVICTKTATVDVPLNMTPKAAASNVHIPDVATLDQNFPNPFNPSTTITYQLHRDADVTLRVHDAFGREIANLVSGTQQAGVYSVPFDASALSSGTYIYTLSVDGASLQRSMNLLK